MNSKHGREWILQTRANAAPIPVWNGADYPRIEPGVYLVRCHHLHGPERVRAFCRWSLRLEFHLMITEDGEPQNVSGFVNMGSGEQPTVGKGHQSKYFRWWTLANGGLPQKGEPMDWGIFVNKIFKARIGDAVRDKDGKGKPDALIYSRVEDLLELG